MIYLAKKEKKGVVLIVTFGIMLVIIILALAVVGLMRQQGRLTEHHIRRRRIGMAAAQAGMVHAYERLRRGDTPSTINSSSPLTVGDYSVNISVLQRGSPGCPLTAPSEYCIRASVNY